MIKITIGTRENPVRFSYANVHQAVSVNGGEPKFSTSIIIPKRNKEEIKKIMSSVQRAIEESRDKFGGRIPSNLKTPLRDGDLERPENDTYRDCFFINAKSKLKPGIVDGNLNPIKDESQFYSGCYGRVSLTFYGFNVNGNCGIGVGLQNIMKTEDGQPLGIRTRVEDDFLDEDDILW